MKEYIEASNPAFSIGEYWDSLAYEGGNLCYNQGEHFSFVAVDLSNWFQLGIVKFDKCCA